MARETTVAEAIQKVDYPDHICPDTLERHGDARPGFHGPGGGIVLYATYINAACGCYVIGNGTLMHPLMIEPCVTHRDTMYPSLRQ